jgi:hypothetical protein
MKYDLSYGQNFVFVVKRVFDLMAQALKSSDDLFLQNQTNNKNACWGVSVAPTLSACWGCQLLPLQCLS